MPTGGSQRYGARDPHWYREPDFQQAAGINPLARWIHSLQQAPSTRASRSMSSRVGNTQPLQSFHKTTGAGAVINHHEDIQRSANQHTRRPWGSL